MDISIVACGDIMPGAEVGECVGVLSIKNWLENVSHAWSEADLVIGNLECPCVVEAQPNEGPLPEIVFHAPAAKIVRTRCGRIFGSNNCEQSHS